VLILALFLFVIAFAFLSWCVLVVRGDWSLLSIILLGLIRFTTILDTSNKNSASRRNYEFFRERAQHKHTRIGCYCHRNNEGQSYCHKNPTLNFKCS
jgi:hypothetical protein